MALEDMRSSDPHTRSIREPDMTITPAAFYQSTVVFESGWSEPRENTQTRSSG